MDRRRALMGASGGGELIGDGVFYIDWKGNSYPFMIGMTFEDYINSPFNTATNGAKLYRKEGSDFFCYRECDVYKSSPSLLLVRTSDLIENGAMYIATSYTG